MKTINLFIFLLCIIMISGTTSAMTGYTNYTANNLSGNVNLNFGTNVNVSEADVTLKNYAFTRTISDGVIQTKMKEITVPASGSTTLTNHVIQLDIPYDADMQADFDDLRVVNASGTRLKQKFGTVVNSVNATIYVEIPTVYADDVQTMYLTYGNTSAVRYTDAGLTVPSYADSTYTNSSSATTTTNGAWTLWRSNTFTTTDDKKLQPWKTTWQDKLSTVTTKSYNWKTTLQYGSGAETEIASGSQTVSSTSYTTRTHTFTPTIGGAGESITVRTYYSATWTIILDEYNSYAHVLPALSLTLDTTEYTLQSSYTLTATVNGVQESATLAYNGMSTKVFNPNTIISNVTQTSNSWNWGYDTRIYWTENTASNVESQGVASAIITSTYTPTAYITDGELTFTYSVSNFSEMYYVGEPIVTIDGNDVSGDAERVGQTVTLDISNMDTTTHTIVVTVPYDIAPQLYTPLNGASTEVDFPPLLHEIDLTWEDVGYDAYQILVAEDSSFNSIIVNKNEFSGNYTSVELQNGVYYWKVRGYNSVTETYSPYSTAYNFTITYSSSEYGTAVRGVVYGIDSGTQTPLNGAIVRMYNDTWSNIYTTGSNGYYIFTGLTNTTYYLSVTKDGYEASNLNIVSPVLNQTVIKNIVVERETSPNYITPHYVKFIVRSFNNYYEDVQLTIYQGESAVPMATLYTDSTGSAAYQLSETTKYRIVAYKQGVIQREMTITPTGDKYTIWVDGDELINSLFNPVDDSIAGNIDITVVKQEIAMYEAQIVFNYLDGLSDTNSVEITLLRQEYGSGNYTELETITYYGDNDIEHTFNLNENYKGKTYVVEVNVDHDSFDEFQKLYAVTFGQSEDVNGISIEIFIWVVIILIVWVGSSASEANVNQTAFAVMALITVIKVLGMIGGYVSWFGIALAWVVTIIAYLVMSERRG